MNIPILLFLGCIVVAIISLQLMGRTQAATKKPARSTGISAWVTVLSTPALLVPAAITGVIAALAPLPPSGAFPFHLLHFDISWVISVAVLVTMSMLVAGFVGLLQPLREGTKPDGRHFWAGIKDHTVALFMGKVLTVVFVVFVARILLAEGAVRSTFSTIFLVAPSLVLAPLLGTTALHPRRPFRALKAAFERVAWDLHGTSRLLCGQILLSVLIWIAFMGQAREGMQSLHILARESSVLSFNCVQVAPYSAFGGYVPVAVSILFTALLMITSTVFMMLYHRRVMNVPQRPNGRG